MAEQQLKVKVSQVGHIAVIRSRDLNQALSAAELFEEHGWEMTQRRRHKGGYTVKLALQKSIAQSAP